MRSDNAFVILDRIRSTLNLLKKSNLLYSTTSAALAIPPAQPQLRISNDLESSSIISNPPRENPILSSFKELQTKIRFSSCSDTIDPYDAVAPFLLIIRAKNMAGPFKLAALEAVSCFISSGVIVAAGRQKQAIQEIIDAVTKCKFIQTDFAGDELVQLYLVRTLHQLVAAREPSAGNKVCTRDYLSDDDFSAILDFCLTVMMSSGGLKRALILHQEAEQTVGEIARFLTCRLSLSVSVSRSDGNSTALCRIVEYFTAILRAAAHDQPLQRGLGSGSGQGESISASSSATVSQKSSQPPPLGLGLGDGSLDADTAHLIFALKSLQALVTCWSDLAAAQKLLTGLPRLYYLLCDDLGSALLSLSCKRDKFPPIVLQLSLTLFSALYAVCAPGMRVLLECFMKQMYIKALHQAVEIFMAQLESLLDHYDLSAASSSSVSGPPPSSAASSSPSAPSPLKHEELEVVLESLCDLLADDGFLPALFASFDCDPTRSDLVQPMIQYLSQCARIVLNSASEELGPNRELGVLVVQAYKQVMSSFLHRLSLSESAVVGGAADLTDLQRLFVSSRHAKYLLQEAARRFEGKSSDGLRYLQQVGALRSPLTARATARFLRIAPDLSKEAVGAFLGELGKDQPKFASEGKEFHQQVLKEYVQSFSLSGQGVLTCMRVFLSAFRLPGEAQQIDRILVAFSEHCHSSCLEGRSGLLENPEVTYLLTFSIIMLNTDRHNPNIRSDRRMTLEQFIRNNTNYGRDVNQTQPLPREFLETIYASISEHQIRTEQHGLGAALTQEMWMEMQLSARRDSRKALLITLDSDDFALGQLRAMLHGEEHGGKEELHEEGAGEAAVEAAKDATQNSEQGWSSSLIARQLLDPQEGRYLEGQGDAGWELLHDPLTLSLRLRNLTWLLDQDMLRCVWKDLLLVCISVHMSNFRVVRGAINAAGIPIALPGSGSVSPTIAVANNSAQDPNRKLKSWQRERTGRALQLSNEFISDLLRLCSTYQLRTVQDTVWLLFAEFTGMTQQKPQNNIAEKLFDLLDFFPMEAALSNAPGGGGEATPPPQLQMPSLLREDCEEELLASSSLFERPSVYLHQLSRHPSAQLALLHWTGLLLRQQPQPVLAESDYSSNLWVRLGFLRDCGLLPSQMVLYAEVEVGAGETLPGTVRAQFDAALRQRDRARRRLLRPKAASPKPAIRSAPASFLSLQGLGEALFGSGQGEPVPVPRRHRRKKPSHSSSRSTGKVPAVNGDEESDDGEDDDEEGGEEDEEGEETGTSGGDEHRASDRNISRGIGGSRDEVVNYRPLNRRDALPYESPLSRHNLPSARWDLGYENLELLSSAESDPAPSPSSSGGSARGSDAAAGRRSIARENKLLALKTVRHTRQILFESGLGQLVSDSRFMEEPALQQFLVGLIAAVESDQRGDFDFQVSQGFTTSPEPAAAAPHSSFTLSCGEVAAAAVDKLTQQLRRHRRPALSAAAVSWLEVLLVDVALRNRDRFSVVWPLLRDHYKRTLSGAGDGGAASIKLSYITERRVTGLLRMSTRMISRDHYAKDILQLLGEIFAKNLSPVQPEVHLEDSDAAQESELKSAAEQDDGKKPAPDSALPLAELSNQLSAGVWALLTLNVDLLPSLPLEQWQTLFAIIAECSASDQSYAAVKAFEIMAWLLHEPRLLAKVPVFCIIGVRPLLTNQLAPLSVSVGAASLLLHLHSRLEVLIKESSGGDASPAASSHDEDNLADSEEFEADTPILWESCWLPILRLLAEGASDSRREVRSACVGALFAAVQDRHIFAVPSGVLVQVLGDILSPAITLLGSFAHIEEPSAAATPGATTAGPHLLEVMEDDWTRVSVEKQNHQPSATATAAGAEELPASASALLLCERGVTVLCDLLLRFTPRLVRYPSFDKLWLRVLFVLGSLLGPINTVTTDNIDHSDPPTAVDSGAQELSPLGRVAVERLRESVAALLAAGVFRRREGLGRVTCDSLRMYQGGAAVAAEFGSAMNESGE